MGILTAFLAAIFAAGSVATPASPGPVTVAPAAPFVAAPAAEISTYHEAEIHCTLEKVSKLNDYQLSHVRYTCDWDAVNGGSLQQLSILRNTIFARQGWNGFRKPWLRDYFRSQAWFRPDTAFTPKRLSAIDRKNAEKIARIEQSFSDDDLHQMQAQIRIHHGKVFGDKPYWKMKDGTTLHQCAEPKNDEDVVDTNFDPQVPESSDCAEERQHVKPDPIFTDAKLSADEKIELGLISRQLGEFALDDGARPESLDQLLAVEKLRQLSLRDLRLLRNTIYARRGRPFKSPILQDHFAKREWYKPDPSYADSRLTKTDLRNVALIKSVEDEFGGALDDGDWKAGPAEWKEDPVSAA